MRVIAVNAVGDGPPSDTTTGTPVGPPDAPPNVQAGSGHQQLTVSWGAPNDGGSAITEYTLQWKSGGQSFISSRQRTIAGTSRTDTIPSLANGTEYTVRVRATTALGDSDWSAEAKGTPREGPHVSLVKVKEPISCTVTFVALEFVNLDSGHRVSGAPAVPCPGQLELDRPFAAGFLVLRLTERGGARRVERALARLHADRPGLRDHL